MILIWEELVVTTLMTKTEPIIYNLITAGSNWRLVRKGARRATIVTNGLDMNNYLGWLLRNRNANIIVHDSSGCVLRRISSIGVR